MTSNYKLKLQGLNCAHCSAKIEEKINKLNGIKSANIDLINQTCHFKYDGDKSILVSQIKNIVAEIEPDVNVIDDLKIDDKEVNTSVLQIGICLVFLFVAILLEKFNVYFFNIVYLISYLILSIDILKKAYKNILKGEIFDENFLMSISTFGAIVIGENIEAIAVMLFYKVGEAFQDKAVSSSRESIKRLMDIKVDSARVLREKEEIVDPKDIKVGEIISVYAGEKIALDGIVVDGESMLDTSSLTGESVYKEVKVNDEVVSGCVNVNGILKIKVTKDFSNSTVTKILELVENTYSRKAKVEKFITKFAKVYTPIVVIIATLSLVLLPLVFNVGMLDSIKRVCTILIISCPCALVISIPLGFYSGIGGLSKKGILVKGSTIIDSLSKVNNVVFDKTGTLSEGVFSVVEYSNEETLEIAAYAESFSNHPIAKSVVSFYKNEINKDIVSDVEEQTGFGISCKINNDNILVGNAKLLEKNNINYTKADGSVVYVVKNNNFIGSIVLKDKIKVDSEGAISNLKKIGIKDISIVSGDNKSIVEEFAKTLKIDKYYGECLPNDKLEIVKDKTNVAFVGDGINDAPVLALVDVGISMGFGSDAAIEVSDVVLMDNMPSKVSVAIKQSKKIINTIKFNIAFAIFVKILVILLGMIGKTNMWMAIFADVGVSVLCILNSMRLLKIND